MAAPIDVYRDWLGIQETARPLNYYQLLRVKQFEDDTAKIREHYRKMNAHVRKYATGDYARQSQELLNELARAMLCLTDLTRKGEYDAGLGREEEGPGRRRTLEQILLGRKVIDQAQLEKARSYADAVGLEVRDALVQQKMATADVVMLAYAESQGLPYIELADIGVDEKLVAQVPGGLARQHSCVPVMVDEGQLLMASPNPLVPDVEEELRLRTGMPVRTVLCTATSVHAAVQEHFPREPGAESPGAAAAKSKSKPARPKREEPEEQVYLTREEKFRRQMMYSVIAFNLAVICMMVLFVFFRGGTHLLGFVDFAIIIMVALAAFGATFGLTLKLIK